MKKKNCKKCGLELPPGNRKQYCSGPRHACWCNDKLNQWRLVNKIITRKELIKSFNSSIGQHLIIK